MAFENSPTSAFLAQILKYVKHTRVLLIAVIFALGSASGASGTIAKATGLFNEGNHFYRDGKFKNAENSYSEAILTGIESRDLYYNIGNTCFRQKKYGWARLYYEKALRLSPGDMDTQKNLKFLASFLSSQAPKPVFLSEILSMLSTTGWVYIVCVLYFALCGITVAKLLLGKKNIRFINSALWGFSSVFVLFIFMLGAKVYLDWSPSGIVVDRNLAVKSAPKASDSTLFDLKEGDKVKLYEVRGNWVFVNMPGKSSGWVPAKSIEKI